jgi:hypothetical protein
MLIDPPQQPSFRDRNRSGCRKITAETLSAASKAVTMALQFLRFRGKPGS